MVRGFAAIVRHSGWRSIFADGGRETHAVYRSLGHQRQWPRRIFLGWCVVSFLTWSWAVFEFRMHRFIGLGVPAFGLLLWLPLMVAFAWPVAVLWERRVEGRHQREIAVLQRHKQADESRAARVAGSDRAPLPVQHTCLFARTVAGGCHPGRSNG